ncbi:ROK family protein [Mesorhizobium sp. BAC0120]|uniref:ROK family protein n=1 Tax=Mesorhizobium sp. BAC0120 TaxID=3090670 RepID=UPI00298CBFE2|nr:ROK family protein [Mesorhizobium sp. BAC0120]MDW6020409.1 ROK family protein [Mesorhizobium sp. BAC0120]
MSAPGTTLALDIGGTKILAALVEASAVVDSFEMATPRDGNPSGWLDTLSGHTAHWNGRYSRAGVAVTGIIDDGCWSALNKKTLDLPDRFPLTATVSALFACPAFAANDAQAAAWGEYRFGAGAGEDMVFLTISTGIGGGIIAGGRLLTGIAGHFGLFRLQDFEGSGAVDSALEDHISGHWMAGMAAAHEKAVTARYIFETARGGASWAEEIIATSARRTAILCRNVQLALDPSRIVIGGGIGLAPGFLERIEACLEDMPARLRPRLVAARLGDKAGVVGIADLANNQPENKGEMI